MEELEALPRLQALLLGPEGLALDVDPVEMSQDLNPVLMDVCGARVSELGHREMAPRSWDWENLLPLLRPGEELLWTVEHRKPRPGESPPGLQVSLLLRFNAPTLPSPDSMAERRSRFEAVLGHFRRQAFPESEVRPLGLHELNDLSRLSIDESVRAVVGVPSPKVEEDGEPGRAEAEQLVYQSLNDVVESCLHLDSFRLAFVVGRVTGAEVDEEFGRVTALADQLKPLVEMQVNASTSTGQSLSVSESTNEGTTSTRQERDNALRALGRTIVGTRREGERRDWWKTAPESLAEQRGSSRSESQTEQTHNTDGVTLTRVHNGLKLAVQSLERRAQALYRARGTGGYRGAILVMSGERSVDLIADSVKGVLAGAQSQDAPLSSFAVEGLDRVLRSNRPVLDALAPAVPVLTDQQAGRLLLLPEAELPGLRLHRNIFLGRNALPTGDGRTVAIGRFGFADERGQPASVEIDEGDLFRHLLVCGTTGSGKTRRVLKILNDLGRLGDDVRVVVFESAKRTYRGEFSRGGVEGRPRIYTVGDSGSAPLRINPFFFERGTSLKRHISVLSDALSEVMPTEALIGPKLREAVERTYLLAGWDIERSTHPETPPRFPSVLEFVDEVQRVAEELEYGGEVKANYTGALLGRARIFLDASFQDIFSHDGNRPIEELFDRDTILELEGLPPSEIDMPALILSVLLERLRSHRLANRSGPKWLLVIEEAHNVLPREAEDKRSGREAQGARTLLKNVVRLLQEGRELGIGVLVVDQAPSMLARGVLKNTNTKIVMRLEDGEEIEEMGRALGLDEEVWPDLGLLRTGEAVVKAPYMSQPAKSAPYRKDELPVALPELGFEGVPVPNYAALMRGWSDALTGRGPEPDGGWAEACLEGGPADGELLRFGLGKALLAQGALEPGFGVLPVELEALTAIAKTRHREARIRRGRELLCEVVRALASWWWGEKRRAVSPNALRYADDLLRSCGHDGSVLRALGSTPDQELLTQLCVAACRTPDVRCATDLLGLVFEADRALEAALGDSPVPAESFASLRRRVVLSLVRLERPDELEGARAWL